MEGSAQSDWYSVPLRRGSEGIARTTSRLTWRNHVDHILARFAVNRGGHRVRPGLYALGKPDSKSPVLVTANYTLSFDAVRSALPGKDAYILVLDTDGINVWCAAGKGSFGTDELVRRIEEVGLSEVVTHHNLILPQLGAPGVSAQEVKKRSGFRVEYGPVRASDLPEYLQTHRASEEMRRVRFDLLDRLTLIPVEAVGWSLPTLLVAALAFLLSGWRMAAGVVAAASAGVVLFPILLPWLPTREFSTKGFLLGGVVAAPFAAAAAGQSAGLPVLWRLAVALTYLLPLPAVTAFLALNFTGSTPVASRSGVRREINTYVPVMAAMLVLGLILTLIVKWFIRAGGI